MDLADYSVQIAAKELTPSELVFLHGQGLSQDGFLGDVESRHLRTRIDASQLVDRVVCTAFIANAIASTLTLELSPKNFFLRLLSGNSVHAFRTDEANIWPVRSLEFRVCILAESLSDKTGGASVREIVCRWIGSDSRNPRQAVISKVEYALGTWQQYDRVGRKFPFSGGRTSKVAASAVGHASARSIEAIKRLLADYAAHQPKVLNSILNDISWAFDKRDNTDWGVYDP